MGKFAPDPPDVPEGPDPQRVIRTQARLNRPDTITPFGTVEFRDTEAGPNTEVVVTPNEDQQRIIGGQQDLKQAQLAQALSRVNNLPTGGVDFSDAPEQVTSVDTSGFADRQTVGSRAGNVQDASRQLINNAGLITNESDALARQTRAFTDQVQRSIDPRTDEVDTNLSRRGLIAIPGARSGFGEARRRAERATFERATNLLDDRFREREQELRQNLANRGQPATGPAGSDELQQLRRSENEALRQAAFQAVQEGGETASRLFNRALQGRQQQFGERTQEFSLENQAANQTFNQGLQAAQFGNQATQQLFQQNLQANQFQNQASQLAQELNNRAARQQQQLNNQAAQLDQQLTNRAVGQRQQLDAGAAETNNAVRDAQLNEALQLAQLQNRGRQQAIEETLQQRNQPLQELRALQGGAPPTVPEQQPAQPIDVNGPFQAQANRRFQAAMQASQSANRLAGGLLSAGGQLGAAAITASDRRLKRAITRIGTLPTGITLYRFRFIGGSEDHVGVMADEVRDVMPDAVHVGEDGYDRVDYAKVYGAA